MNKIALEIIRLYQRHISPKKGYRCAYGKLHDTYGCSGHIKNIIKKEGLISGFSKIQLQFKHCSEAAEELKKRKEGKEKRKNCASDIGACSCDAADCISGDCTPDLDCGDVFKACV